MNRYHKYDVSFSEYVMASGDPIKNKRLGLQQFSDVGERNIMWTSLYSFEQFLPLCHDAKLSFIYLFWQLSQSLIHVDGSNKVQLKSVVAGHDALENGVAFLADVCDAGAWVVCDKCRGRRKRIDLERNAFDFELVGDDLSYQLLFELADVEKPDADAGMLESIERLAMQRKKIFIRQLDLHAKLVADQYVVFPARKTAADADLLKPDRQRLTIFGVNGRRYIERKSNMLALIQ